MIHFQNWIELSLSFPTHVYLQKSDVGARSYDRLKNGVQQVGSARRADKNFAVIASRVVHADRAKPKKWSARRADKRARRAVQKSAFSNVAFLSEFWPLDQNERSRWLRK